MVAPSVPCMVITPIAPHSLSFRCAPCFRHTAPLPPWLQVYARVHRWSCLDAGKQACCLAIVSGASIGAVICISSGSRAISVSRHHTCTQGRVHMQADCRGRDVGYRHTYPFFCVC